MQGNRNSELVEPARPSDFHSFGARPMRKADGDTLRSFSYLCDMAGCTTNVLMEGEALPSRRTVYGYDMLDRLVAAHAAAGLRRRFATVDGQGQVSSP